MARPPLPSVTRRPASTRLARSQMRCQGVSLTELLIGLVISIVVLGGAVRALVSLIRADSVTQAELNRKDDVGRILGLMQDEIRNARRVESGAGLATLSNCSTAPSLILRGFTANEDISYGLLAQGANATWRGPNVLVRCGPSYNADGSLNTASDTTANRSELVVLDAVADSGFTANTLGGNGTVNRNVELFLISNASGPLITSSLQVPINSNQVYGLVNSGATTCPDGSGSISTGCADPNGEAMHYKPTLGGGSISGSANMEDVFYFDGNRSDYTLSSTPSSGTCTNEQCTVRLGTGGAWITFFDGDVIVFKDLQIRL